MNAKPCKHHLSLPVPSVGIQSTGNGKCSEYIWLRKYSSSQHGMI